MASVLDLGVVPHIGMAGQRWIRRRFNGDVEVCDIRAERR
jgi:hypothetical protein